MFTRPALLRPLCCARSVDGAPKPLLSRLLTALLMIAALVSVLGAPRAAYAGYYQVTYSGGTIDWSAYNPDPAVQAVQSHSSPFRFGGGGYTYVRLDYRGTATATVTASVTAHFHWVSDAYNPYAPVSNPPSRIVVKESASASWFCQGTGTRSGSANCGMLNPVVEDHAFPWEDGGSSSGVKYTTKINPGRDFDLSGSPSATVTGSDNPVHMDEQGFAGASYNAQIVDRRAGISRPGAHDETFDPDGTTHGDTVYSYVDTLLFADPTMISNSHDILVTAHFDGRAVGEWSNPQFTWSPSGDRYPWSWQTQDWMELNMPFGKPNIEGDQKWHGTFTSATTKPITLTVTDDYGSETAKYELKVHDRVEEFDDHYSGFHRNTGTVRNVPGFKQKGYSWAYSKTDGGTWSFSINSPAVEIWPWFPVLGLSYTLAPPQTTQEEWPFPDGIEAGYHHVATEYEIVNHHIFKWRSYDAGGQVFADRHDHNKKHEGEADRVIGSSYDMSGPISDKDGFDEGSGFGDGFGLGDGNLAG